MILSGSYKFLVDGNLIAESKNVITANGKKAIKRYLAGTLSDWAGGMAIGTGTTAATTGDTALVFEVDRQPTTIRTMDGSENIILKASFPTDLTTVIKEIGIYPFSTSTATGTYQDSIITDFSETTWTNSTSATTNSLVGVNNITNTGTSAMVLSNLNIDISGYSSTDQFQIQYYNNQTTTKNITISVGGTKNGSAGTAISTTITLTSQPVGFYISTFNIGTNLDTITSISITVSAGTVSFDAMKFLNTDETDYITGIVSRSVLASPITKTAGQTLEVEYSLAIT